MRSFVQKGEAYYASKGVVDAATVFDEAIGNYVGHRTNMWLDAKQRLDSLLIAVQSGKVSSDRMEKVLGSIRKDYQQAASERVFGYDSEGARTSVPLREDLRNFADQHLLEGKIQDKFENTFTKELGGIQSAAGAPESNAK